MRSRCPPGVFCLTPGVLTFLVCLLLTAVVGFVTMTRSESVNDQRVMQAMPAGPAVPHPPVQINVSRGGDDRYTRAPEPTRFWAAPPDNRPVGMFGVPTHGFPEQYQSYGFLTTTEGQTLPLYGRRTVGGGSRFNYYTRTDSYNPVPVPIRYKGRDCQDSVGCDELFNNERVKAANGMEGEVKIYQFDGPMYLPGVL